MRLRKACRAPCLLLEIALCDHDHIHRTSTIAPTLSLPADNDGKQSAEIPPRGVGPDLPCRCVVGRAMTKSGLPQHDDDAV
jgi:hypothetical protein